MSYKNAVRSYVSSEMNGEDKDSSPNNTPIGSPQNTRRNSPNPDGLIKRAILSKAAEPDPTMARFLVTEVGNSD